MGEIVCDVKTVMVSMECPECKIGLMNLVENDAVLTTYPPLYLHKCGNCGYERHFARQYPYYRYELV